MDRVRGLVLATLSLCLMAAMWPVPAVRAEVEADPPSIVLIVTDDQRWDTLWAMRKLRRDLVAPGVTFSRGYVTAPICCPSRASTLTGLYPMHTGVWRNVPPDGGFASFSDGSTIATWLTGQGYTTGLFGKYLNGYTDASYIPPGWTRWYAHLAGPHLGYEVSDQGTLEQRTLAPEDYSTDDLAREATSFIRSTSGPLFAYVAMKAPHSPYTPAARHADAFPTLDPWRPPSYNERDVSDKPAWVQLTERLDVSARSEIDGVARDQYRMLLAVDDAVRSIVRALRAAGRLHNTLIVFTSDNGFAWGEHRLTGKGDPYEESIRVPLVVRYDPLVVAPGTVDGRVALNIDLAPTIAAAAGASHPPVDGRSLLPLLGGEDVHWRNRFLTMMLVGEGDRGMPSFCQLHTTRRVFTRYATGEEEDYRLRRDPWQLENLAGTRVGREDRRKLRRALFEWCDPLPPGMFA